MRPIYDFNSTVVQLEELPTTATPNLPTYFNSTVVQLEAMTDGYTGFCNSNFNSTVVQLEVLAVIIVRSILQISILL